MWQSLYGTFETPKITEAIMNNLPGIALKPSKHWAPYPDHARPSSFCATLESRHAATLSEVKPGVKRY